MILLERILRNIEKKEMIMLKLGEEVFVITTERFHGRAIVQVKKGYITDLLQNVENGILSKKYMVEMRTGVSLFTEDTVFTDYEQALNFSKKLQKEIDNDESAIIKAQVDMLLKHKELNNKSLKEGLRWLIEHGFIEVLVK